MTIITDYIATCPTEQQPMMYHLREVILSVAPELAETLSWQMPTFKLKHNIIHFAPAKNHLGIYPGSEAVEAFTSQHRLDDYYTSKGTIRLPWSQAFDEALIRDLVQFNLDLEREGSK